jgi:hypothetical protein
MKSFNETPCGPDNFHLERSGDELRVTLTYPPRNGDENPEGKCRYIEVNQESVRASDGIRLYYDYARDGFVIQQASTFSWEADDQVCDPDWQEVAFIQPWAREKEDEDNDG